MSEIINSSFLGHVFIQDPITDYIKIDNVTLGESEKFAYNIMRSYDIGNILKDCLLDNSVVCVVYNFKEGVAYLKTGFDLTLGADSKVNTEYTTFIVKQRIAKENIAVVLNKTPVHKPQPTPTTIPTKKSNFVKLNKLDFELNGRPFVPVGANAFYLGLLQETMNYPTNNQITEAFEASLKLKATVIRSHTLGFSSESNVSLLGKNNVFNPKAWAPIDFAFSEAKRTGIKLLIPLCDPYEYYHGSLKTFCVNGVPKDQFFTHPVAINEFKKYLKSYLNHVNPLTGITIKNSPEVFAFELGNELGQKRPTAGSIAIPTRAWIKDITIFVKSIAVNTLILNGSDECLGSSVSDDFKVSELDIFSAHFYWNDFDRLRYGATESLKVNRPYIIGEYSSKFGSDWFKVIETTANVKGTFVWSLYPHLNGQRVKHDDGFTFWLDSQTPENTKILLTLTNHFRRLQKISQVTSI